jgi:hypothetical protein
MSWEATFSIYNNTTYNITVTHNATGDLTTIPPNGDWTTTTDEVNNTNALKFWQQSNVWYMQGSCSFGPEAGVYVDRGWMAPKSLCSQQMVAKLYLLGMNLNQAVPFN